MFEDIRNAQGERIDCSFTPAAQERDGEAELVVIGHGVTGNKDREWAVVLASELAAAGFSSLRISFSGNGESEGDFRESTPTKEAADLSAVLDHCGDFRVTFVGHSMGGAVGVLCAKDDKRITRLISLAGMVETADFVSRKFGELTPGVSGGLQRTAGVGGMFLGAPGDSEGLQGSPRDPKGLPGTPGDSVDSGRLRGSPGNSMGTSGTPWDSGALCSTPGDSEGTPGDYTGAPCDSRGVHEFPGIPGISGALP